MKNKIVICTVIKLQKPWKILENKSRQESATEKKNWNRIKFKCLAIQSEIKCSETDAASNIQKQWKVPLSMRSFHLKSQALGFYPQTQNLQCNFEENHLR